MAITNAQCDVSKRDFLNGVHLPGHVYKLALIKTGHTGTYGAATTSAGTPGTGAPSAANLGTDECAASGNYPTGGITLTGYTVALTGGVGSVDWDNPHLAAFTGSADGAILYNDTASGKPTIATFLFANAPVAATGGALDLTIPTSGTGLVRYS